MDVDVVDDPSGVKEAKHQPQPVQRAKRTYGSKRAPQSVEEGVGGMSLVLSKGLETGSPVLRPLATSSSSTTSVLGTDWREQAKKIDDKYRLSDDEDDESIHPVPPRTSPFVSHSINRPAVREVGVGVIPLDLHLRCLCSLPPIY
jgi:hypothetical protein